jgi:hypothetical protein
MRTLEEVVNELIEHTGDLDLAVRFAQVDAQEVHDALEGADEDSADGVVLRLLAKHNPLTEE